MTKNREAVEKDEKDWKGWVKRVLKSMLNTAGKENRGSERRSRSMVKWIMNKGETIRDDKCANYEVDWCVMSFWMKFSLKEFEETWKETVPSGFSTNLQQLEVCACISFWWEAWLVYKTCYLYFWNPSIF